MQESEKERSIREAAEYSAKEFILKSPADDWSLSEQEWIKAIFMTAFVKGAIWEKENRFAIRNGSIQ